MFMPFWYQLYHYIELLGRYTGREMRTEAAIMWWWGFWAKFARDFQRKEVYIDIRKTFAIS